VKEISAAVPYSQDGLDDLAPFSCLVVLADAANAVRRNSDGKAAVP
jgi:hypothetical protein